MKKIIIIDELTTESQSLRHSRLENIRSFRSTPKLHSTGRRTSRHMIFLNPALGEIIGKKDIGDQSFFEIAIVYGNGYIYDRTPHANAPSNENFFIHESEIDNFPEGKAVYDLIDPALLTPRYLIKTDDNETIAKDPRRFDIIKMMETGKVVLDFTNEGSFFIDEITPAIEDKTKILALAKQIAIDNGAKIMNAPQFLEEEYADIEFNAYRIDLYRNLTGHVNVKFDEFENFKNDLTELLHKYHVDIKKMNFEIDSETSLNVLEMDTDDIQTYMADRNLDVNEILEKNRGFINGTKFGL